MLAYRGHGFADWNMEDDSISGTGFLPYHSGEDQQRGLGFSRIFQGFVPLAKKAATKIASVAAEGLKKEAVSSVAEKVVESALAPKSGSKPQKAKSQKAKLTQAKVQIKNLVNESKPKKRARAEKRSKSPLLPPAKKRR